VTAATSTRGRIVVTGGAGFIGSELVRQAAEQGHAVVAVDNLVNGRRENLADVLSERVTLLEADVRDVAAWSRQLEHAACVYHLACLGVRHSVHAPIENHEVNATATLRLLAASRDAGVPRFVYVSSSEVYGTATRTPMTEDHPTSPHTVYGASKLAGECYTRAYHDTYGYSTVVVRPFNAYGPRSHHEGDSGEVIPRFMLRCLAGRPLVVFGDGSQTRDFSYVGDTAGAILASGENDQLVGQTVNLGYGAEVSINQLAQLVQEVVGRKVPVEHHQGRPGDVLRLYADTTRAARLMGYRPRVDLRDGLAQLLEWYRAQPQSPDQLLEAEVVHNWMAPGARA
jgi:UDP-glucose 4-epimerase